MAIKIFGELYFNGEFIGISIFMSFAVLGENPPSIKQSTITLARKIQP